MENIRRCSRCGRPMSSGWVWGDERYCSDECLHAVYSREEVEKELFLLDDGLSAHDYSEEELDVRFNEQDECYYTEWDSVYED